MPPGKTIIHATLDPADVNKDVPCALAVLGDAKLVLAAVIEEARRQGAKQPEGPAARSLPKSRRSTTPGSRSGCPS